MKYEIVGCGERNLRRDRLVSADAFEGLDLQGPGVDALRNPSHPQAHLTPPPLELSRLSITPLEST